MNIPVNELDFKLLESRDRYALYFNHLSEVFSRLMQWYGAQAESGNHEAGVTRGFLERLLDSVEALRLKYTYHPSHSLKVDVTDSGFPSSLEILNLSTDLLRRDTVLRELPHSMTLKRQILDYMFKHYEEPSELLWQVSEREFLELLHEERLFLAFNAGQLERLPDRRAETDDAFRTYLFSWACYDYVTSRPYVHVMTFDQDADRQPLEELGASYAQFVEMVKGEGSRAPDVGLLAMALDAAMPSIHPKIIKRMCIGPLFSKFLVDNQNDSRDPTCAALVDLLSKYARHDDDFVLFFDDEVIFSKRQEVSGSILSLGGRVREIFHIQDSDPECYRRRASVIHRNVLLPHSLLQHVEQIGDQAIPGFAGVARVAYTERGELHGV